MKRMIDVYLNLKTSYKWHVVGSRGGGGEMDAFFYSFPSDKTY